MLREEAKRMDKLKLDLSVTRSEIKDSRIS